MLKVKICGMRREADVACAGDADYLGFVLASPKSHRNLAVDAARRLMDHAGSDQRRVVVTVESRHDRLAALAEALSPDALQLHRGAPPDVLRRLRDAFPATELWVATDADAHGELPRGPWDALVVDARTPEGYGGTGRVAPWPQARSVRDVIHPRPLVLAGGLTPGNVADAALAVRPAVVDVSSGVEGEKGKVPERVAAFISAARGAEVNH